MHSRAAARDRETAYAILLMHKKSTVRAIFPLKIHVIMTTKLVGAKMVGRSCGISYSPPSPVSKIATQSNYAHKIKFHWKIRRHHAVTLTVVDPGGFQGSAGVICA